MKVQFWGVGASQVVAMAMTAGDISGHLLTDWIPSFPLAVSSSFMGWPNFLIDTVSVQSQKFLTLAPVATKSERQWKSVLSWMLGVAGARHALAADGYRWVAPLSAFYERKSKEVAVQSDFPFPVSSIKVSSDPTNTSALRPDYLALRPTTPQVVDQYDWALVEAKGTSSSLTKMSTAPVAWANQVRNAIVKLNGIEITSPRHLVICTRVNPNAARRETRRIQIRSWNKKDIQAEPLSGEAAAEVAAAHLFGLFKGLHLPDYAAAVAASVTVRVKAREFQKTNEESKAAARIFRAAREELTRRQASAPPSTVGSLGDTSVSLTTPEGAIDIALATPLLDFTRELIEAHTGGEATAALQRADKLLDAWVTNRRAAKNERQAAILNTGVAVSVRRRS